MFSNAVREATRRAFLNSFPTNEVQYTLAVQNQVGTSLRLFALCVPSAGDENLESYIRMTSKLTVFLNSFPDMKG